MKIFTRDKEKLKTAMRVAILTVAAIAGNSHTAQAGGIVDFLTKTAEFIYKSRQPIEEFRTGMSRINNEIRAGKAAFEQASYNLTDTEKQVLDVYNRVAPKQSPRQGFAVPYENPSQTRGQGNDVAPQKQKDFDTAKKQLLEKINENEQNLAELNGDVADQEAVYYETVGDKQKNKVKEADHQETVGDTQKNKVKSNQSNEVSELSTQGRLDRLMTSMVGRTK